LGYLKIAHYVVGGFGMLFGCFPLMHVAVGVMFVTNGAEFSEVDGSPPPPEIGWIFVVIGLVLFLLLQAAAIATIVSGRFLGKRKNYTFSFVVACILCVFVPVGTILGVFTLIVLTKDPVKKLYGKS